MSDAATAAAGPEPLPCLLNRESGSADAIAAAAAVDSRVALRECSPGELAAAVRQQLESGARRILVAGGDGSIAAAAGVLAGSAVELGVLPGGTLNHFARHLGVPVEARRALHAAVESPAVAVDVAYVQGRLFLNTASVGAYSAFVRERERREGRAGYYLASLIAGARTLLRLPAYTVDLELDGRQRRYHTPLLFVGVGERELQAPVFGERVADGGSGLHLIAVQGGARARLLVVALAAAARGLRLVARTPHLDSFLTDHCTIETAHDPVYLAIDGEPVEMRSPLHFRIARGALRVAAPPPPAS